MYVPKELSFSDIKIKERHLEKKLLHNIPITLNPPAKANSAEKNRKKKEENVQ